MQRLNGNLELSRRINIVRPRARVETVKERPESWWLERTGTDDRCAPVILQSPATISEAEAEPPQAQYAGQARRVSPDLARDGSGCPVLGERPAPPAER
jgi:hypothetical protein